MSVSPSVLLCIPLEWPHYIREVNQKHCFLLLRAYISKSTSSVCFFPPLIKTKLIWEVKCKEWEQVGRNIRKNKKYGGKETKKIRLLRRVPSFASSIYLPDKAPDSLIIFVCLTDEARLLFLPPFRSYLHGFGFDTHMWTTDWKEEEEGEQ